MNFIESSGGAWVWRKETDLTAGAISVFDESSPPTKTISVPPQTIQVYEPYNSRVCPCDGERHYLELMTHFDGATGTFFRKCYRCGREWTATERLAMPYPPQVIKLKTGW